MAERNYEHDKKQRREAEKEILSLLAKLGGKTWDDDDITYSGQKMIIPESMTLSDAVGFLKAKAKDMETETSFSRTFHYRPWDGAYCMWNAFKKTFGAVVHNKSFVQTMFGEMEAPPQMHTVATGTDTHEQVPWGQMELPFLPGVKFKTDATYSEQYGAVFMVTAIGAKKYRYEVEGVFNLIQKELEEHSLYRGKAFDGQEMPVFVDLSAVDPERVVYSDEVMQQLSANIWAQLRYTDLCEQNGIPLKRAVLIHGPYGTGKTLAAILTGQIAVENGWTFIKARPGRDDLSTVMKTAMLYQPAVVFYEDVDQIAAPVDGDREGIARLLDDFDGVEAKGTRILCVLTTNHPERIHQGMARPGRLDAMIEINELDKQGVEKLVRTRISREKMEREIDWDLIFQHSEGYKPAFVTEFADRALRYVIVRTDGHPENVKISTEDLINAADGLRPQFVKMMDAKDTSDRTPLSEALEHTVRKVIQEHRVDYDENGLLVTADS